MQTTEAELYIQRRPEGKSSLIMRYPPIWQTFSAWPAYCRSRTIDTLHHGPIWPRALVRAQHAKIGPLIRVLLTKLPEWQD